MCRISCGVTKLDHIRSTRIRGSLHIKKSVVEKLHDDRNGWFKHVLRRPLGNPVRRAMTADIQRKPRPGRPMNTWLAQMEKMQQQQQQQEIGSQRHLRSRRTHPSGGAVARR